jgi:hypothetical protein
MALVDEATFNQIRDRLAGSLAGPVELRLFRKPGGGRLVGGGEPRGLVRGRHAGKKVRAVGAAACSSRRRRR